MEWINVKDAMPPVGENVLVSFVEFEGEECEDKGVAMTYYDDYTGCFVQMGTARVTHWAHLPPPAE